MWGVSSCCAIIWRTPPFWKHAWTSLCSFADTFEANVVENLAEIETEAL